MSPKIAYVLSYGAYVAILHAVDGPWRSWKVGREGKTLDPWTLQHVAWGALAGLAGITQLELLGLGVLNELVELGVRRARPDLLWGSPETIANVAGDLVAAALGRALVASGSP